MERKQATDSDFSTALKFVGELQKELERHGNKKENWRFIQRPRTEGAFRFICTVPFILGTPGTDFIGMVVHDGPRMWSFTGVKREPGVDHATSFSCYLKDFVGHGFFVKV